MRIYEDNFAYEIERVLDPATQVNRGWRYKLYRIRPVEELLFSGDVPTRAEAEASGKKALQEKLREDRQGNTHKRAS